LIKIIVKSKRLTLHFEKENFNLLVVLKLRHPVAQLVEALTYKLEGRGFDSRLCHWNFHRHNPSGRTMTLGLTQTLTEMSTRNTSWG
jgi:hypothetical protein